LEDEKETWRRKKIFHIIWFRELPIGICSIHYYTSQCIDQLMQDSNLIYIFLYNILIFIAIVFRFCSNFRSVCISEAFDLVHLNKLVLNYFSMIHLLLFFWFMVASCRFSFFSYFFFHFYCLFVLRTDRKRELRRFAVFHFKWLTETSSNEVEWYILL